MLGSPILSVPCEFTWLILGVLWVSSGDYCLTSRARFTIQCFNVGIANPVGPLQFHVVDPMSFGWGSDSIRILGVLWVSSGDYCLTSRARFTIQCFDVGIANPVGPLRIHVVDPMSFGWGSDSIRILGVLWVSSGDYCLTSRARFTIQCFDVGIANPVGPLRIHVVDPMSFGWGSNLIHILGVLWVSSGDYCLTSRARFTIQCFNVGIANPVGPLRFHVVDPMSFGWGSDSIRILGVLWVSSGDYCLTSRARFTIQCFDVGIANPVGPLRFHVVDPMSFGWGSDSIRILGVLWVSSGDYCLTLRARFTIQCFDVGIANPVGPLQIHVVDPMSFGWGSDLIAFLGYFGYLLVTTA